jgi:hypothetical protein
MTGPVPPFVVLGCEVAARAARSSCNRASYPGDGVTVGGAAFAFNGTAMVASDAAIARPQQNRFIRSLPEERDKSRSREHLIRDRSYFKTTGRSSRTLGAEPAGMKVDWRR